VLLPEAFASDLTMNFTALSMPNNYVKHKSRFLIYQSFSLYLYSEAIKILSAVYSANDQYWSLVSVPHWRSLIVDGITAWIEVLERLKFVELVRNSAPLLHRTPKSLGTSVTLDSNEIL
jgi:hypothetical protein